MEATGFIFARGGSKGLPGKNIRLFGGKPLLAHSIEHALAVKRINRIIVSTDSEEIANVALEYGAEVPFIRPSELASDSAPEWLTWKHAINYLAAMNGSLPEAIVSIPPTAPLRLPIDIENCLDEYEKGLADIVITTSEAHRSPYFNMVQKNEDGTVGLVIPPPSILNRRQDVPITYDMATVCYVINCKFVLDHNSIFEGKVRASNVPIERAVDIDTLFDFQLAEYLFKIRKR